MMEGKLANPLVFGLKDIFDAYKIDAFWIKDLTTIRYLTGFTGSTAQLLLSGSDTMFLLVDSRYTTQAGEQCPKAEVLEITSPIEDMCELAVKQGHKRLGFEANSATFANYKTLVDKLPDAELIPIAENLASLRIIKTPEEINFVRKACDVAHVAYTRLTENTCSGTTEKDSAWVFDRTARELGAQRMSFDTLVCSGARSAIVHGAPSDKKIERGDFLIVDRGVELDGWCSDETNTLVFGAPSEKQKKIYQIVQDAHDKAIDAVKAGAKCVDIDAIARNYIADKGYSEYFGHGLGHGVGLKVHELPVLSPRGKGELVEGMLVTVEPGIYIPDWGGIRVEDLVLVTSDGCEVLTKAEKRLLELP